MYFQTIGYIKSETLFSNKGYNQTLYFYTTYSLTQRLYFQTKDTIKDGIFIQTYSLTQRLYFETILQSYLYFIRLFVSIFHSESQRSLCVSRNVCLPSLAAPCCFKNTVSTVILCFNCPLFVPSQDRLTCVCTVGR